MAERILLLSIPQLRRRDVTPGGLASLEAVARRGGIWDLVPAFPGTAAASFATMMTGVGPAAHGIVGDTYYDRAEEHVVARPYRASAIRGPKLWEQLRATRPGSRSLLWFTPFADAGAEVGEIWIGADGPESLPEDLKDRLIRDFGPYPCPEAADPGLEPTAWILRTAAAMIADHSPDLAVVRVPFLGQIARRYGPDGREAGRAVRALEEVLKPFLDGLAPGTRVVAATESITTPVSDPCFPNLTLRALGLLRLNPADGGGLDVDLTRSAAFALADHHVCQIYVNDPAQIGPIASAFSGPQGDGVARVASLGQRSELGLDHPRAGDIVLIAAPDRWFAPDWWERPEEAPRSAHASTCGLAHVTAGGLLLDVAQVQGSVGALSPGEEYLGVVVSSAPLPPAIPPGPRLSALDLAALILDDAEVSATNSS